MIVRTVTQLKENLQQKASALLSTARSSTRSASTSSSVTTTTTTTTAPPHNTIHVPKLQEETGDDVSVIYLVRHGDRFDYANPSWLDMAKSTNTLVTDPPLSALGHRQATDTGHHFASLSNVSHIFVSPYLRVIQTACPTSEALDIPLCIEEGFAEAHATPHVLPSSPQRYAYFPQIDPTYSSSIPIHATPGVTCAKTGNPCESFGADYVKRMKHLKDHLEEQYRGQTIICFSHAASVALVAAFVQCSLEDLKFAPCGIYQLTRVGDGPWTMSLNGSTNPHVRENSPTTYPWGFAPQHFEEEEEDVEDDEQHQKQPPKKYYGSSEGIGLDFFVVK